MVCFGPVASTPTQCPPGAQLLAQAFGLFSRLDIVKKICCGTIPCANGIIFAFWCLYVLCCINRNEPSVLLHLRCEWMACCVACWQGKKAKTLPLLVYWCVEMDLTDKTTVDVRDRMCTDTRCKRSPRDHRYSLIANHLPSLYQTPLFKASKSSRDQTEWISNRYSSWSQVLLIKLSGVVCFIWRTVIWSRYAGSKYYGNFHVQIISMCSDKALRIQLSCSQSQSINISTFSQPSYYKRAQNICIC